VCSSDLRHRAICSVGTKVSEESTASMCRVGLLVLPHNTANCTTPVFETVYMF
jgi:hypothetical protein